MSTRRGVMASIRREAVRGAEERVATAYADLAMAERALAEKRRKHGVYLRRGGVSARAVAVHLAVMEWERRLIAARSRLVNVLQELSAVRYGLRPSR